MRITYRGGPFDGNSGDYAALPNGPVDVPTRLKIGSRWASVSHYYSIQPTSDNTALAIYEVSEFEWKEGMQG